MKEKLNVSFSGGRTSAVMTKLCLEQYKDTHEIIVTFSNTGCEHPDTLRFVDACDRYWGFNTVWLEAVVTHGARIGIRHKVVNYASASRNGEPFEQAIKKYGIFNRNYPNCTGRLKTEVIESYLKSIGWFRGKRLNYYTAIGIRADEIDRVSAKRDTYRFIYPLVSLGWTKPMVIQYMQQFDWDLQIPEHCGNCVWCWKKSNRKLLTLAKEMPEVFEFPRRMEEMYGKARSNEIETERRFFRGQRSVSDIIKEANTTDFVPFTDPNFVLGETDYSPDMDWNEGCSESCEVYPTDGT